jgi:hypothetical protein
MLPEFKPEFTPTYLAFLTVAPYVIGMIGVALVHALADRKYISNWKGPPDLPRIATCSCPKRVTIPKGKKFVICPRCKGVVDNYKFSSYLISSIAFPFALLASCPLGFRGASRGETGEFAALLFAVLVSATILRFLYRCLSSTSKRLANTPLNTPLNSERLRRYAAQKAARKLEDQLDSCEVSSLEPSVLTAWEQTAMHFINLCVSVAIGLSFGAWTSLIPVAVAVLIVLIDSAPTEAILLYCHLGSNQGRASHKPASDAKREKTVASLFEALEGGAGVEKLQAIVESYNAPDPEEEEEDESLADEELESPKTDDRTSMLSQLEVLRTGIEQLKAELEDKTNKPSDCVHGLTKA